MGLYAAGVVGGGQGWAGWRRARSTAGQWSRCALRPGRGCELPPEGAQPGWLPPSVWPSVQWGEAETLIPTCPHPRPVQVRGPMEKDPKPSTPLAVIAPGTGTLPTPLLHLSVSQVPFKARCPARPSFLGGWSTIKLLGQGEGEEARRQTESPGSPCAIVPKAGAMQSSTCP